MGLRIGLPAKLANTDASDTRYDWNNLVACNADASPRGGLTSPVGTAVLSSTATMDVNVGVFAGVAVRDGGVIFLASDGPDTVTLDAAPSANSRIDVVTARQNDSSSTVTTPDANDDPVYVVIKGDAAPTPTRPIVPDGSLDLGDVLVPSTATATNSDCVVISPTGQFTAAAGASVPFQSLADLRLWTTAPSRQHAHVFADSTTANNGDYVFTGTAWAKQRLILGVQGLQLNPLPTTAADVPSSSVTFTLDAPMLCQISAGCTTQINVASSTSLYLNIDGTTQRKLDATNASGQVRIGSSTVETITLAAGSHTIKLQGSCIATNTAVAANCYWSLTGIPA